MTNNSKFSGHRSIRRAISVNEVVGGDRPLRELRVLELGHIVAAPYTTLMLSDLGAEVVKVEHPDRGDQMRTAGAMGRSIFASLNRDKYSVGLDLKSSDDSRLFRELVTEADVLVENFSPGALENLELGYERLCEENETLIQVSIKGYGGNGPYADRTATDPIIQAMSGLMSMTGHPDTPPARAGTSVIDIATAQNAVIATLLALRRRHETGTGEHVTVPLFRTGVTLMGYWLTYYQQHGVNPRRQGAAHPLYVPYDIYPTSDREHVFIAAASDDHWQSIETALGLSLDLDSAEVRRENREMVDERLRAVTRQHSRRELVETLSAVGVPAAPVNDLPDLVDDPHLTDVGAFTTIDTPETDDVVVPWTIPWTRAPSVAGDPPDLDADTADIFDSPYTDGST